MVQLSAENEISGCPASVESGATGVAVVQINADTGEITYRVVAFNLPARSPAARARTSMFKTRVHRPV